MTDTTLFLCLVAAALVVVFLVLWARRPRTATAPIKDEAWILIDGSNVMHWQDGAPDLVPLTGVVSRLVAMGYVPGVVFDANAGWKLRGRYMHDGDLARLLGLETRQVLVVPKGTQADPYLLQTAREFGARIVTNDRYRDWAGQHPEVLDRDFLIRGGMRNGQVWLQDMAPVGGA